MEDEKMLVLCRKRGEQIVIGENIEVVVLEIRDDRVKLGFKGPLEVPIHRQELHEKLSDRQAAMYRSDCA